MTALLLRWNVITDVSFLKDFKTLNELDLSDNEKLNLPKDLKDLVDGSSLYGDDLDKLISYYRQSEEDKG